jgi:hypothetical protein
LRDRAIWTIALSTAAIAAIGIAVSVWYVLPRVASGRPGPATATASPTPPPVPAVTTFAASADTYVQADTPTTGYGTDNQVVVDGLPQRRTFLRFTVVGLAGQVTRAVVRLHPIAGNSGSDTGGTWRAMTDTSWSETGITWKDQPTIDGATLATLGPVTRAEWYEIDVTSLVTGNGTFAIAGESTIDDGAYFDTRETGETGPQLVVTTG